VTLVVERYGDVHRLRMSTIGSRAFRLDVSAYVVRGMMIDSGLHRARRELLSTVAALNVRGCVVTHWHEDHAGNAASIARNGIPLMLHPETEAILRRRPAIALYRRFAWGRPPALDVPLTSFDLDGLEVIHTPGHSADHQVVWDSATRTLFSGDLWLGVRSRMIHEAEDPFVILDSLRRVSALEPLRMFDAHRGLVEPATRAIERKIEWLGETLVRIEQRIASGWSDDAIVRRDLGGEPMAATVSRGEYTTGNLVRAVRRHLSSEP
jgi:Zn-dependent hydrolases, including glyoxylases